MDKADDTQQGGWEETKLVLDTYKNALVKCKKCINKKHWNDVIFTDGG